jgi:hypothetical protein
MWYNQNKGEKGVCMVSEEGIKKAFFIVLKEGMDELFPQDKNISFAENPFVDVNTIAKECGITAIHYVSPENIFHKHAILIGTEIFVNNQDNTEKQRFAIAHETFHFLTDWPVSASMQAVAREGEAWKKQNAGSTNAIVEVVSDYFAANLLIPAERFILWEDKPDEEIARAFGVEAKCIRKRREEIEQELDLMAPQNLSSNVKLKNLAPLSLDALDHIMEGHNVHDTGRA